MTDEKAAELIENMHHIVSALDAITGELKTIRTEGIQISNSIEWQTEDSGKIMPLLIEPTEKN